MNTFQHYRQLFGTAARDFANGREVFTITAGMLRSYWENGTSKATPENRIVAIQAGIDKLSRSMPEIIHAEHPGLPLPEDANAPIWTVLRHTPLVKPTDVKTFAGLALDDDSRRWQRALADTEKEIERIRQARDRIKYPARTSGAESPTTVYFVVSGIGLMLCLIVGGMLCGKGVIGGDGMVLWGCAGVVWIGLCGLWVYPRWEEKRRVVVASEREITEQNALFDAALASAIRARQLLLDNPPADLTEYRETDPRTTFKELSFQRAH